MTGDHSFPVLESIPLLPEFRCSLIDGYVKAGVSRKQSTLNLPKNIFYPMIRIRTCAYHGVKNFCFSEKLTCFVFLKHPFMSLTNWENAITGASKFSKSKGRNLIFTFKKRKKKQENLPKNVISPSIISWIYLICNCVWFNLKC